MEEGKLKHLYLIRHAKSSWAHPDLTDFKRPLNKRGKANGPEMANRLSTRRIFPDSIVSSPAKRAKKTAHFMAAGTKFNRDDIVFSKDLYLGEMSHHLNIIETFLEKNDILFLIGHNHTITDLANYLTGESLYNVPTCGIVGVAFSDKKGFSKKRSSGEMLFFDYPKKDKPNIIRK
jgi:phosphohistidine phosphatase